MKNAAVVFLLLSHFLAQQTGFCAMGSCRVTIKAEENGLLGKGGKPLGPAILFSDPVAISAFKLRFVDGNSKQPIVPSKISIAYGWKWLEYPYPEHSWGAWSEASDIVECFDPESEIQVPEFVVRPRGWYDGKFVKFPFRRRPLFTGVGVILKIGDCTTRATISPGKSKELQCESVVFRVNCNGESTIVIGK